MESILISIKKLLGISEDDVDFDTDLVIYINSVFFILNQMGIGPEVGFTINDDSAVWNDFMLDAVKQSSVKTYIYLKVKSLFDPPLSSTVVDAMNRNLSEIEWRLNLAAEREVTS